jgi:hypothetical protein
VTVEIDRPARNHKENMRTIDLWKKRQDIANLLMKSTGDSATYSEIESLSAQYVEVSSALAKAMEEGDAWRDMFPLSTPAEIGAIVAAYRDEHPITPATTRRACKSV